jgi:putative ABC transport system substrate-binding protein
MTKTWVDRFMASHSYKPNPGWLFVITLAFTLCGVAQAQQAKIPKIGYLGGRSDDVTTTVVFFKRAFHALGYVEGKNFTFEYRNGQNRLDRYPALLDELIRLKVDVLLVPSQNEAVPAKKATQTIPIVGLNLNDPVSTGLVESLARPGGNLTGFTRIDSELIGKRLEIIKEIIPKLNCVAVLRDPRSLTAEKVWKELQVTAKQLGLQLYLMSVSSADKLESAFTDAKKAQSGAFTVSGSPFINSNQKRIAELAIKYRLPGIYFRQDWVANGGLMSYSTEQSEPFKRVAVMVDKILKGTNPADIPVERPTRFEFVINLKAAKQIGLTIPPEVLARANKIIR